MLKIHYSYIFIILSLFVSVGCGKHLPGGEASEIITSQIIVGDLDWKEVTLLSESSKIKENAASVGYIDLPVMGSRCTGFMISESIFMTNQHCIPTASHARGVTVVFDYLKGTNLRNLEKYDCSEFIGNNRALDYALLKCDGLPGQKFGIAKLSESSASVNEKVYIVQQNCDYYNERDCEWTKKYSKGKVTRIEDELVHNADTLGGSSGSPMFSEVSHKVIGLHHAGNGNNGMGRGFENYAVPMNKIVSHIKVNFPSVISSSSSDQSDNNDSFASATNVSATNSLVKKASIESSNDVDFYKFKVSSKGTLEVSIKFKHFKGDLDLKMYDSNQKEIAKSESTGNFEKVKKEVPTGTYFVKVFGYKGATNDYELNNSFAKSTTSTKNDTFETATAINLGYESNKSISSSSDKDYYSFAVSSSKTVSVDIQIDSTAGDLDLFIYDKNKKEIAKSYTTKKLESVSKYLRPGKYYILVKGYRGAKGKYKISLD